MFSMKIKFILLYIIVLGLVFIVLNIQKDAKIQSYLDRYTLEYSSMYEMHYHQYEEKSKIIFKTLIQRPEIIDIYKQLENATKQELDILRNQLYRELKDKYEELQGTKLQQLHFHLPDNKSFLRFHRVGIYGDDLSDVRETIAYVNKYKKPVDGFEEGRIYSGYRFVFPIASNENNVSKHLGSVEISFNISVFVAEFMEHFNVLSNYHIRADVVERKVWEKNRELYNLKSPVPGYYMEKNILQEVLDHTQLKYEELKLDAKTIEKMLEVISLKKSATVHFESLKKVITIIPVQNSVTKKYVAFVTIRGDGSYIEDIMKYFYITLFLSAFSLFIIFLLLYKKLIEQVETNKYLREQIEFEVEKNREKDMELLRQAKMVSLGEMFGNIAHQWRQPLNTITTTAISLEVKREMGTLQDKDIQENVAIILERGKYLSEVINVFKDFVRGSAKQEKVVIQDVLESSLHIVSASLRAFFIELKKEIDYDKKIYINLVKGELSQVIINIINNAKDALAKRKDSEKWIKIALYRDEEIVRISIEDNGGGIDPNDIEKIFDPYFSTKHKSIGTGLGLSMSHKIITKSMNGKLYVKNTKNGAKFFIELPLETSN